MNNISKEVQTVFNNHKINVMIPQTLEASNFFGRNNSKEISKIIFALKEGDTVYHFSPSNEFLDQNNEKADWGKFVKENPEILTMIY